MLAVYTSLDSLEAAQDATKDRVPCEHKCHILNFDSTSWTGCHTHQKKNRSSPYRTDWQSVYGTPINSHFLTCADHHDLPPSIIVWALRLSALHLLISGAFCSEKGNCQQRIYKSERKQKEAVSEMFNFHSARLMGEERGRQGGDGKQNVLESLQKKKGLCCNIFIFNYIPFLHLFNLHFTFPLYFLSEAFLILPPSLNWYKVNLIN